MSSNNKNKNRNRNRNRTAKKGKKININFNKTFKSPVFDDIIKKHKKDIDTLKNKLENNLNEKKKKTILNKIRKKQQHVLRMVNKKKKRDIIRDKLTKSLEKQKQIINMNKPTSKPIVKQTVEKDTKSDKEITSIKSFNIEKNPVSKPVSKPVSLSKTLVNKPMDKCNIYEWNEQNDCNTHTYIHNNEEHVCRNPIIKRKGAKCSEKTTLLNERKTKFDYDIAQTYKRDAYDKLSKKEKKNLGKELDAITSADSKPKNIELSNINPSNKPEEITPISPPSSPPSSPPPISTDIPVVDGKIVSDSDISQNIPIVKGKVIQTEQDIKPNTFIKSEISYKKKDNKIFTNIRLFFKKNSIDVSPYSNRNINDLVYFLKLDANKNDDIPSNTILDDGKYYSVDIKTMIPGNDIQKAKKDVQKQINSFVEKNLQ